jgi:hypothetical protein
MPNRLLDRQLSLLEYLTSGDAIFGHRSGLPIAPCIAGIECRLLDMEARFSHDKRIQKIREIFPRTFKLLRNDEPGVVEAFTRSCPPVDISRLVNARQFADFLAKCCRESEPAWLCDVAACELAIAQVRSASGREEIRTLGIHASTSHYIRRPPEIALLRCGYDLRPLFEQNAAESSAAARDTRLVVAAKPGCEEPQVFELPAMIFDLLAAVGDWTELASLGASSELMEVVDELAAHRLIEVSA